MRRFVFALAFGLLLAGVACGQDDATSASKEGVPPPSVSIASTSMEARMEAIYRKAGAADEQISKLKDISVRILEARQKRDFDMVEELKKERASLLTAEQKRKIVEMIRAHNEAMAEETTSTADSDTTVSEDPATTVTS